MKQLPKSHRTLAGNTPSGIDVRGMSAWLKTAQKGGRKWSGLRVVNKPKKQND